MSVMSIVASGPIHAPADLVLVMDDGTKIRAPSGKTVCGLPLVNLERGIALRYYGGKVECSDCRKGRVHV